MNCLNNTFSRRSWAGEDLAEKLVSTAIVVTSPTDSCRNNVP